MKRDLRGSRFQKKEESKTQTITKILKKETLL